MHFIFILGAEQWLYTAFLHSKVQGLVFVSKQSYIFGILTMYF